MGQARSLSGKEYKDAVQMKSHNQKELVDIPDSKEDLKSILPVPCTGIQLL